MSKNTTLALTATLCAFVAAESEIPSRKPNEKILAENIPALRLYRDHLARFATDCEALRVYEQNGRNPNGRALETTGESRSLAAVQEDPLYCRGARVDQEHQLIATVHSLEGELDRVGFTLDGTLRCRVSDGSVINKLRVERKK